MKKQEIARVAKIVAKETAKFKDPIVTRIAEKRSVYQVLVSCLLSLRTRDETTEKASRHLFRLARTPKGMARLPLKKIEKSIYPVGFYKTKARRIKQISKVLVERYNSKVPGTQEELLELKGVGRKTANIVLTYGFGKKDYIPVDVHVNRIPNRLGWVKTRTPEQTEKELMKIVPKKYWHDFNNNFVVFGQNICKPVRPLCRICPVKRHCEYYKTKERGRK